MNYTRLTLATASSVLVLAALAACGSDISGDTGASAAAGTGQQGQTGRSGPGGAGFPGAQGKVAAVSGSTAQVQSQMSGQVAVTWNGRTTFTQEVDGSLDDVAVGSCVVVTTDDAGSDGSDATAPATEVTAASVRITAASDDGSCGFGMGGGPGGGSGGGPGGGERPEGAPSGMPSDMPSDLPDGARRMGGFGTIGKVTAVSGSGFTVSATARPSGDDSSAAATTDVTVTVNGDTTYSTTAKAAAAAVKTGVCVNARGQADDTGAVTATSIAVSQPVDGECGGGFGMGGPGGRPGNAS